MKEYTFVGGSMHGQKRKTGGGIFRSGDDIYMLIQSKEDGMFYMLCGMAPKDALTQLRELICVKE